MRRDAEALTAKLVALRPWIPLLSPRKRQLAEMRSTGTAPTTIADQLGLSAAGVVVAIAQARQRLEVLRVRYPDPSAIPAAAPKATPGPKPGSRQRRIPEPEPAEDPAPPEPDAGPPTAAVARAREKLTVLHGRVRSKTIAPYRLSMDEKRDAETLEYPPDIERPATRGQCADMPRPCPFVSCRHHLYLEVDQKIGSIKLNVPHLEVWEMRESCALDVADRGGITLEEVGAALNITRERIRQVETRALENVRERAGGELGIPAESRG